ncbi:hypothetical protein [Methanosarcina sp.]|uniref:hypothetical protein n=1 Tax=Methanosarcina sp. TaxID=2213 RepID=UPI0029898259|nr:hypothetical protein [Methanosarcina sp.]MDW5550159.1 hypothetical protein [Methanosarcina sp.]MDW5555310.1 hypothetical protein [Methanosarcina sp.]MDW5560537.1 hypothetical protein [Methanosarcina sp.]
MFNDINICHEGLEACLKLKRAKNFRQFCEVLKESVYNNNFKQEIKPCKKMFPGYELKEVYLGFVILESIIGLNEVLDRARS